MQISETKLRPVRTGSFADRTTAPDQRPVGIKVIKTSARWTPTEANPERPLTIRHTIMRDALLASLNVAPEGAEAIGKRLQLLLGLGLRRNQEQSPGRGRAYSNGLAEALDAAFAFALQRAFVPPSAIVSLMLEHRPLLDAKWAAAARGERSNLTVSIDALFQTGRDGVRTGRFSEDPSGTLSIVGAGCPRRTAHLASPPRIVVDLTELYDVTIENLRQVGVPVVDLHRAGAIIGADYIKLIFPCARSGAVHTRRPKAG